MLNTIREELTAYIEQCREDGLTTHHQMFNESYYIVGYYQSSEWLKNHGLDALDAINECRKLELQYLGEIATKQFSSHEVLVNKLVYFYGLQLCAEVDIFTGLCQ